MDTISPERMKDTVKENIQVHFLNNRIKRNSFTMAKIDKMHEFFEQSHKNRIVKQFKGCDTVGQDMKHLIHFEKKTWANSLNMKIA